MASTRISVVLIDDSLVAREGIVALIRSQPGFQVLAASANIEESLRQVRETRPTWCSSTCGARAKTASRWPACCMVRHRHRASSSWASGQPGRM